MSELTREQLLMSVISGRGPAYLKGVDLSALNLTGAGWLLEADLREANLSHANLSRANLKGADLREANLYGANLSGANLEGANLHKAKMIGVHLRAANLKDVNLTQALLITANLAKANLRGANLERADLEGANLESADLRDVRLILTNLKMAKLQGAIPQAGSFLDGCGKMPFSVTSGAEGFTGSIASIQLIDLVQLLTLSRNNLLIRVGAPSGTGAIYVRCGSIQHAETATLKGEEAIYEMLSWEGGRFETAPLPEGTPVSIRKPLEHLIIESARLRDEEFTVPVSEYRELMKEIRRHIPVPAHPSEQLLEIMDRDGRTLNPAKELQITDVFDTGDPSGILCSVLDGDDMFISPLKLLSLREEHPLYDPVAAYRETDQRDVLVPA